MIKRSLLTLVLLLPACAWHSHAQAGLADVSELAGRAHAEQVRGDLQAAGRDYKELIRLQPHAIEWRINLGLVQYEMKEYAASAATLQPVVMGHRDEFVSHLFLGLDQLALHEPAKAISALETAEALRPSDPQVPLALARAYAGVDRYTNAMVTYRRARELNPSEADVLFETGMAYLSEVEQLSRRLLDTSPPGSIFVRTLLGDALMDQHRYNEALKTYTEADGDAPPTTHLCLPARRAFALFGMGDVGAARQLWQTDAEAKQGCRVSLLGLMAGASADQEAATAAALLRGPGGQQPAVSAMDAAWLLRALPKDAATRLTERLRQAGLTLSGLTAVKPDDLYPSERTVAASRKDCANPAADAGSSVHPLRPVHPSSATVLVLALVEDGRFAEAAACADAALERTPKEPELLFWSIRLEEQLASEALESFQASAPDAPRTHLLLGDMDRQRGALEAAQEQYRIVLKSEPHNLVAAVGLSIAYLRDGKTDQAIASARAVLAEDASSAAANQVVGEALIAKRAFAEAEEPLRAALAHGAMDAAHLHALLGRAEAELGHTTQAIQELELGAPSDVDGSVHFQLSRLYHQVGDQEAARKAAAISAKLVRQRLDRGLLETADRASSHDVGQP